MNRFPYYQQIPSQSQNFQLMPLFILLLHVPQPSLQLVLLNQDPKAIHTLLLADTSAPPQHLVTCPSCPSGSQDSSDFNLILLLCQFIEGPRAGDITGATFSSHQEAWSVYSNIRLILAFTWIEHYSCRGQESRCVDATLTQH